MLTSGPSARALTADDAAEIRNWYEKLVFAELGRQAGDAGADFLADAACLALNRLPARYIRHGVDMAFYLPEDENAQMDADVEDAVREALAQLQPSGDAGR